MEEMETPVEPVTNLEATEEQDIIAAKAFLLSTTTPYGTNLYDHLAAVLKGVLAKRPLDSGDIFEQLSKDQKREKYTSDLSTIQEYTDASLEVALAQIQRMLFDKGQDDAEDDIAEEDNLPIPNLMELAQFFEASGFGLNREEMYRIWLSIKALAATYPIANVRFWGKIFGTEQNYHIAEVEFEEGQGEIEEEEEEGREEEEAKEEAVDDPEEASFETGAPKPKWTPPPVVPSEGFGEGANKFVYFACAEPGRPWVRLPKATPAHIQTARRIRKFFSGNLDKRLVTYPPFGGQEKHYLRAQIARISAATLVSPIGLFQFDDEEEPEEEGQDNFTLNADFEGLGLGELIDPGFNSWVHHSKFLLQQGRCTWWNPKAAADMEEALEEEEEGPTPEMGLPLLSPLSEDRKIAGQAAWTPHISSKQIGQFAFGHISSNLWPGAHAFSAGSVFGNIYVGWGQKFSPLNFNPFPPPKVMNEYEWGPEIVEMEDPTPEEEAALRAMLEAKTAVAEGEGEGEQDEEENPAADADEDEDEDEDED